jgi:hypothetical protein
MVGVEEEVNVAVIIGSAQFLSSAISSRIRASIWVFS